jgi:hypothetical protein
MKALKAMIDLATAGGAHVLLLTAPYLDGSWEWTALHRTYNDITRRVATEKNVALVDVTAEIRERPDLFARDPESDACHFNAAGASIIASAVVQRCSTKDGHGDRRKLTIVLADDRRPRPAGLRDGGAPDLPTYRRGSRYVRSPRRATPAAGRTSTCDAIHQPHRSCR